MSRNTTWRVLGALLLVGTVGFPYLRDHLEKRLGNAIVEELESYGNGAYTVLHGRVRIDLWDRAVSLEQVELRVDTSSALALKEYGALPERLAQFRIERMYVRTQLLPLLLHNELEIRSVLLERPQLVMHEFPLLSERNDVSFRLGMLYEAIADRLVAFGVRYFTVLDGSIRLEQVTLRSTQALAVKHVDLWIEDLHIDSTLMDTSQRYLPVGDVRLRVGPQRILLADSIHELSFSELRFGLKGDSLSVDRLRLHPVIADPFMRSMEHPVFEISLHAMRVTGLDLHKVYSLGTLNIDLLDLDRPVVRSLSPHEDPKDRTVRADRNSPLSPFSTAQLGELTITQGELELRTSQDAFLLLDALDLHLEGIELDPASSTVRKVQPDRARVAMSRSIFGSIRSGLRIFTGPISWSQLSDSLLIRSIDADRLDALVASGHVENGHLDTLLVRGADMERAIRENVLHAKGMELRGFDLHLPDIHTRKRKRSERNETVLPIWSDGAHFDELVLAGRVTAIGSPGSTDVSGSIDRFDLRLYDIDLDSVELRTRPLVASQASVSMWGVDIELPKDGWALQADGIRADSRTGMVNCRGGHAQRSKGGVPAVRTSWEVVGMEGLDVNALLQDRTIALDRLVIGKPDVFVSSSKRRDTGAASTEKPFELRGLRIGKVQIHELHARMERDGEQVAEIRQGTIRARNLEFDPQELALHRYLVTSDSLVYNIKGISAALGGGGHLLNIESLLVDASDSIAIIRKVDIRPVLDLAADADRTWITIPEIISRGYEPLTYRKGKRLSLGKVLVHAPRIRTERFTKERSTNSKDARPIGMLLAALPADFLSGTVDTIQADRCILQGGSMDLVVHGKDDLVELQFPDVEVELVELLIGVGTRFTRSRPLPARRVVAEFLGAQGQLNGKPFPVRADRIRLDLPEHGADLTGVHVDLASKGGTTVKGRLDAVEMRGPSLYQLLKEEEFHAEQLVLRGGALDVVLPPLDTKERAGPKPNDDPFHQVWSRLRDAIGEGTKEKVGSDELRMDAIRFRLFRGAAQGTPLLSVDEFGASLFAIRADRKRVFEKSGVDLDMKGIKWHQDGGKMKCSLTELQADHRKRTLHMSGLKMVPQGDRSAYARSKGHRFDAIDLALGHVRFDRFDLDDFLEKGTLSVGRISCTGLVFDDLRDHRLEHPNDVHRDLLGTLLRKSTMQMDIDTLMLSDGLIRYSEIHEIATRPGKIRITDIDLLATNIRNVGKDRGVLSITMNGRLQDKAPLHVEVDQDLADPRDVFTYRMQLGAMDMTELSEFIEPVLFLRLRSGNLDTLRLVAAGNDDVALGQLEMYYDDLQITVLSKKAEDQTNLGSGLASLAANALVRKNRYERPWSDPEPLYFERWKDRGFPNYLVKIYLSGLSGAVGLGGGKQRKEMKRTDEEELKRMLEQVQGAKP